MLIINNLYKSFGPNSVLINLNLKVNKAELIHIKGYNGSGKSTLFKIICDILEPNEGHITFDQDVRIGALIENPGFLERENLEYNLKYLSNLINHFDEQKVKELCERLNLDYSNRSALKTYSVGMRQKVGIIQAIMENQNLILFDEPTRGLDEESVKEFSKIVNELINQNKSVIIASHDILDDLNYTKIYIMKDGSLYEEGV